MRSLAALAGIATVLALAGAAAADAPCTFLEISATSGKDPVIDADLKPLEKKLKKPPFSSWNVFHVLSRSDKTLVKSKPEVLPLKSGKAGVMLRDRTDSRVNLEITVDDASGKRILDTKPDLPASDWLVLGSSANNDGHLLAISCK